MLILCRNNNNNLQYRIKKYLCSKINIFKEERFKIFKYSIEKLVHFWFPPKVSKETNRIVQVIFQTRSSYLREVPSEYSSREYVII